MVASVGGMTGRDTVSAEHLAADAVFGPCLLPECPNYSGRLALVADPDDDPATGGGMPPSS